MKKKKHYRVVTGDILEWARTYTGPKFHALFCDPPYEIGFMGKGWDNSGIVFDPKTWKLLKKHLHPGAFCFAFSSTRTLHRMMVAIEDAGFILHPMMALWQFASGFPKATNPSFAIDKMYGVEREVIGKSNSGMVRINKKNAELGYRKSTYEDAHHGNVTKPGSDQGRQWSGHRYGLQALKPAFEPVICFQKPYPKKIKPVVSMVATGAGCLNIDGGRIGYEKSSNPATNPLFRKQHNYKMECGPDGSGSSYNMKKNGSTITADPLGRWPSNLILSHLPECRCVGSSVLHPGKSVNNKRDLESSKTSRGRRSDFAMTPGARRGGEETITSWVCVDGCPVKELDQQSGNRPVAKQASSSRKSESLLRPGQGAYQKQGFLHQDSGTASRYYFQGSWEHDVQERLESSVPLKYVPKPSKKEKDAGILSESRLADPYAQHRGRRMSESARFDGKPLSFGKNTHPTVKPLRITEYLAKLLLPPKGYKRRILVPFAGSGSEMIGARQAGWDMVIGVELLEAHTKLAKHRLRYWETKKLDNKKPEGVAKK